MSDGVGIMKISIFEILDCMSRLMHCTGRLMSYSRSLGAAREATRWLGQLIGRPIAEFFSPFSLEKARVDWASCIGRPVARNFCFSAVFPTVLSDGCERVTLGISEVLETLFWEKRRETYVKAREEQRKRTKEIPTRRIKRPSKYQGKGDFDLLLGIIFLYVMGSMNE